MAASPATLGVEAQHGLQSAARTLPAEPQETAQAEPEATDQFLYLIGHPPMRPFLHYVSGHHPNPPGEASLTDAWSAAQKVVQALEQEEAGIADDPPIGKLGPEYEPLLRALLKDPLVRNGFNTVPTEVAMVELDRTVVYQERIDVTFARRLAQKLGSAPTGAELFRICLPYDHPQPPVKWTRVHHDKFVFQSPSNDLRFLGPMPMEPAHIVKEYPPPGSLVGVVGIAVGFGSNFMNAVYAEKRLILTNGSHRAYTLRKLGVTHAPCIVQHVSSRDELDLVAASEVRRRPEHFLKGPRPATVKDYFDPRLHKVMQVQRRLRQVTVRFEVDEHYVPAL